MPNKNEVSSTLNSQETSFEKTNEAEAEPKKEKKVQITDVIEEVHSKEDTAEKIKEPDVDGVLTKVDSEHTIKLQADATTESKCFPSPDKDGGNKPDAINEEEEKEENNNEQKAGHDLTSQPSDSNIEIITNTNQDLSNINSVNVNSPPVENNLDNEQITLLNPDARDYSKEALIQQAEVEKRE